MKDPAGGIQRFRIPALIKRNTALFALSQTFTGAGMQFAYGLGPLMAIALTGSATVAGLAMGLLGLGRFFVSYPVGKITDTYGRKPAILLGLVLALAGGLITGASMNLRSFAVFVVGLLVFSMGMSAAQQLRVAAVDMFPPHHRAQALGYVAAGSMFGLLVSPLVVALAESIALDVGQDPLGLPWFFLPGLIVPGMFMIWFVRPDPKEIGMNLGRYYPGYAAPPEAPAGRTPFRVGGLLRDDAIRLAIVANCSAQANMSIVMVLAALAMSHHGNSLAAIAFSYTLHSVGMFGFTVPLGRLADRIGREPVMFSGVAMALVGAGLVAFVEEYWWITLGAVLVGLGWAAANVAATALIADRSATHERGRAIGVNDSFSGGITLAMALVTGPVIQWGSLPAAGLVAVLVTLPPLAMLVARRVRMVP